MKTITDISIQKNKKNRVNISLDGSFFCSMELETVIKNKLKKGTIISEKILENIQLESEKLTAFNMALNLINKRFKTQKEIYKYLEGKGYIPSVIFYCIDKLKEYKYINDEHYAESFVNYKSSKDGIIKIKQELLSKGVSDEIIDSTLAELPPQTDLIKKLSEKYMNNKEDTKENYIKLIKYLLGKGFVYEDITKTLKGDVD